MIKKTPISSNESHYWTHRDKLHCWHPFTQIKNSSDNILIDKAKGVFLYSNNKKYIDAISSWWVNIHGHNHPNIIKAINNQSKKLSHVMFSGFTHKPAIELAEKIISKLPYLNYVFYTDNGSTAIEASLKMCIQFYANQNKYPKIFLAFNGAYHGNTFGSMAVGKTSGFYAPFTKWLFDVEFIDYPYYSFESNIEKLAKKEQSIIQNLDNYLTKNYKNIAGFIYEPLVQAANGMKLCRVEFLDKIIALCKKYNVICIADEVMTGFGRTGKMLASDYMINKPDLICVSKGLTGGHLTLGACVASKEIYNAFVDDNVMKAFLHGHSYTANPIACNASIANINLFDSQLFEKVNAINQIHIRCLHKPKQKINIINIRVLGTLSAFEIGQEGYVSKYGTYIRTKMLEYGIFIRPLGNTVYILPPYCIRKNQLELIYKKLLKVVKNLDLQKINNADIF